MFDTIFTSGNVFVVAVLHLAATASSAKKATTSSSSSGEIIYLLFMVLIVYVGWRLIFRPQSQRAKQQRQTMSMLSEGDDVITTAGIYGTVLEIDGDKVHVRVSDNCVMTMARGSIAQRMTTTIPDDEPYGSESDSDGSSDEQIDDYGADAEGADYDDEETEDGEIEDAVSESDDYHDDDSDRESGVGNVKS
ncbi:MAG: preprotein translocase subunit YajC [Actinobacteria bacterium]|nr:preprotein translocase subunit YajC [Actinomycetota bacterium]